MSVRRNNSADHVLFPRHQIPRLTVGLKLFGIRSEIKYRVFLTRKGSLRRTRDVTVQDKKRTVERYLWTRAIAEERLKCGIRLILAILSIYVLSPITHTDRTVYRLDG